MATSPAPRSAGLPSRPRILTNSAAEFVELRSDESIGTELAERSPEFVPELDRFVTREQVPSQDYFAESQKQVEKFKETLLLFQKNLVTRKADQKYEIDIKDASDYTLEDVLKIAQTVQKKHAGADQVHSCMGRLKRFFRATGRNASTFKRLLALVPDDIYGSVICGGFTIILGTLERLDKLRTDMFLALDRIPATLHRVHNLMDVHYQSTRLKQFGDSVLVAIFVLLERIVRELSTSAGKKIFTAPFKGDRYGVTIDETAKSLDEAVKDFENEAKICDSQRLGQVDTRTMKTEQKLHQMDQVMQAMDNRLGSFFDQFSADKASVNQKSLLDQEGKLDQEEQNRLTSEKHGVDIYQQLYQFLAANPSFDSKTGKLDVFEARKRLLIKALSPISSKPEPFSGENRKLVKSWTKISGNAHRVASEDLRQCLDQIGARPSQAEQDRIAYILTSPELRDLLRATEPVVMVTRDTSGDIVEQYSAASYASAMIIFSIQKLAQFPVLYHFCTARSAAPSDRQLSGLSGLYMSLISQLLQHVKKGSDVELGFLKPVTKHLKSDKVQKPKILRRAFRELVQRLPESNWLFIVIDSVWKLESNPEAEKEVRELLKLVGKAGCRIKLFVTDPFSLHVLNSLRASEEKRRQREKKKGIDLLGGMKIITLEISDHVESHLSGFNVDWLQDEVAVVVRESSSSSEVDSSEEDESEQENDSSDGSDSDVV